MKKTLIQVPGFTQNHSRNQFEVLIYTSPDRWHNVTEPTAIPEFQKMANRHAFGLTLTQLVSNFTDEFLEKFDVIVFLHSTTSDLSAEQLKVFRDLFATGADL
ncbi:hypothetical protein BH23BAC1_BH23BAC1_24860 [soil metagenome]